MLAQPSLGSSLLLEASEATRTQGSLNTIIGFMMGLRRLNPIMKPSLQLQWTLDCIFQALFPIELNSDLTFMKNLVLHCLHARYTLSHPWFKLNPCFHPISTLVNLLVISLRCRTPLIASIASNVCNLSLDMVFIFGFGWGVFGAALATSVAQYLAFAVLFVLLLERKMLYLKDLARLPSIMEFAPLLKVGFWG